MSNNYRYVKLIARILAIVYILFISIFALDVFSEGYSWWQTIVALFMHLIPSFILTVATIVAWNKPALGGVRFVLLGLISVFFFNTHTHFISFALISLPAFLIGALFFWDSLAQAD